MAISKSELKAVWFMEQLKNLRLSGTTASIKRKIERLWARAEVVATQADAVVNPPT